MKLISRALSLLTVIPLMLGCQSQPPVDLSQDTDTVKVSQEDAKKKALETFELFGGRLKGELQDALKDGGPVNAVTVCKERAPALARQVGEEAQIAVGRSSARLRNPDNAPEGPVADYLAKYGEGPAKEAPVAVEEWNDQWMVVAPIPTGPLCLTCHGEPETMSAELKQALKTHYPEDEAVGFKAGDLRGVFWAEIPKEQLGDLKEAPLKDGASRNIKTH